MSKNRIWRNLFAQKRAALGKLRNFFGAHFVRPFMLSLFLIEKIYKKHKMQKCGPKCPKCSHGCPENGVSCFREKAFGVLRGVTFCKRFVGCPKTGKRVSRKKLLAF
jgi:flavoprotein